MGSKTKLFGGGLLSRSIMPSPFQFKHHHEKTPKFTVVLLMEEIRTTWGV